MSECYDIIAVYFSIVCPEKRNEGGHSFFRTDPGRLAVGQMWF